MQLTQQHLGPIFENISALLDADPGQLQTFEPWAVSQIVRLRHAAESGTSALAWEAELMREELGALQVRTDFTTMVTVRTERIRLCQRQWLTGLLDFVDDLLDGPKAASVPWAA